MKADRKKDALLWFVTLLPFPVTCLALPFMADQVPMHYDLAGNIDRWGSKYENFIFPVIILLLSLFWLCVLNHYEKKSQAAYSDKERKEAQNNKTVIYVTAIGTGLLYNGMQLIFLYAEIKSTGASKSPFDITMGINLLSGLLLIGLGNILPKTKRNSLVGLRTTWSMKDDEIWAKSNRFAGKAFVLSGILIMIETLFLKAWVSILVMLGILIGAAVLSAIYSYRIWAKNIR